MIKLSTLAAAAGMLLLCTGVSFADDAAPAADTPTTEEAAPAPETAAEPSAQASEPATDAAAAPAASEPAAPEEAK